MCSTCKGCPGPAQAPPQAAALLPCAGRHGACAQHHGRGGQRGVQQRDGRHCWRRCWRRGRAGVRRQRGCVPGEWAPTLARCHLCQLPPLEGPSLALNPVLQGHARVPPPSRCGAGVVGPLPALHLLLLAARPRSPPPRVTAQSWTTWRRATPPPPARSPPAAPTTVNNNA